MLISILLPLFSSQPAYGIFCQEEKGLAGLRPFLSFIYLFK